MGKRTRYNRKLRHRFGSMPTSVPGNYQQQVNDLTGAMGPVSGSLADWKNTMTTTGDPWSMNSQPLYYNSYLGKYVTSFEANAAPMSIAFEGLPNSNGVIGTWNQANGFGRSRSRSRKSRFGRKRNCGCGLRSRFGSPKTGGCGCGSSSYGRRKLKRRSRK